MECLFSVVSLFPELIEAFANVGIVRRARLNGIIDIRAVNPRDFAQASRGRVDDAPYGGGPGMVMAVEPLREAIRAAKSASSERATTAYLSPQGRPLSQDFVAQLSTIPHLILVAGRYEGIDERVVEHDVDIEISLGDFILSGGEVAAMAVIDAVVRTLPGSLGSDESAGSDSFSDGLLEYPQYTRPDVYESQRVPAVLLGGNHAEIARWRRKQALGRTWLRRPDLIQKENLNPDDQILLKEFVTEQSEPR